MNLKTLKTKEELLAHIELTESFKLSNDLIENLKNLKAADHFYVIPLNEKSTISIIVLDNVIINKTFYKKIDEKSHIHRDNEPAVINYLRNGKLKSQIWYQKSVISSGSEFGVISVEYKYFNVKLSKIYYQYENSGNNIFFNFILYDFLNKKVDQLLFNIFDKTFSLDSLKYNEKTLEIYNKILKMNQNEFFNLETIKSDIDLLKIQFY